MIELIAKIWVISVAAILAWIVFGLLVYGAVLVWGLIT